MCGGGCFIPMVTIHSNFVICNLLLTLLHGCYNERCCIRNVHTVELFYKLTQSLDANIKINRCLDGISPSTHTVALY